MPETNWTFAEAGYTRSIVATLQDYIETLEAELENLRELCEPLARRYQSHPLVVARPRGPWDPDNPKGGDCTVFSYHSPDEGLLMGPFLQDMKTLAATIAAALAGLPGDLRLPVPPAAERETYGLGTLADEANG